MWKNKTQYKIKQHFQAQKLKININPQTPKQGNSIPTFNLNYVLKTLMVPKQNITNIIQVLSWRTTTSLPIIKSQSFTIQLNSSINKQKQIILKSSSCINKSYNNQKIKSQSQLIHNFVLQNPHIQIYTVKINIQTYKHKLSQIDTLPLAQIIFLLKQALIGFQNLVNIFGIFQPDQQFIFVNKQNKWKFWVNKNLKLFYAKNIHISIRQFLLKILSIAQKHCLMTNLSNNFFSNLKEEINKNYQYNFSKIREKINQFVSTHKIFQTSSVVLPNQLSPRKKNYNFNKFKQNGQLRTPTSSLPFSPKSIWNKKQQIKILNTDFKEDFNFYQKMWAFQNTQVQTPIHKQHQNQSVPITPAISCPEYARHYQKQHSVISPKKSMTYQRKNNFHLPVKQTNMRKYSQKVMNINTNKLAQRSSFKNKQGKANQFINTRQNDFKQTSRFFMKSQDNKKILSHSPHDTSSTLQKKYDKVSNNQSNYKPMKMKDLIDYRNRNNNCLASLCNIESQKYQNNMTISQQILVNNPQNHNKQTKKKNQLPWVNHISDLFSDNASIRIMKSSINLKKQNEDQLFQKQHLKNIKLDLLDKFGRKANVCIYVHYFLRILSHICLLNWKMEVIFSLISH